MADIKHARCTDEFVSSLFVLHAGGPGQPGSEAVRRQSLRADTHAGADASRDAQASVRNFLHLLLHHKEKSSLCKLGMMFVDDLTSQSIKNSAS